MSEAKNILDTAAEVLDHAADALPKPWNVVASALGAAAGFAADLIGHGLDPKVAIQEVRSMLPNVDAAKGRVDDLIRRKAGQPPR